LTGPRALEDDPRDLRSRGGIPVRTAAALTALAALALPAGARSAPEAPVQLPPPVAGQSVNLKPARGTVCFTPPGATGCTPLVDPVQVPLGTTVDTRRGRVTIVSAADLAGGQQDAWFYEGVFTIGQTGGAAPVTELRLAEPLAPCPEAGGAGPAAKRPRTRKLWGDGEGRFRTRGEFAAATVRGTKWVVVDRCDGTLTRVVRGSVTVRDAVRDTTIVLRAGEKYLARRPS
jgi:hypothetical protein